MGASFTCLASRPQAKCEEYGSCIATFSPAHSIRRRSRSSTEQAAVGGTLQEASVNAVATAVAQGRIYADLLSVLPIELLQRVIDRLVEQDGLTLSLLQGVLSPWLHHLHLQGLCSVDDTWMPVLAGLRHCASLNISGATVTDGGLMWLSWLRDLKELSLAHCLDITDAGLMQVSQCVSLRVVDVEGCEGLTSACLPHLSPLTALTSLNLGQCPALKGHKLHHIAGLRNLQRLSFGWCRALGAAACDPRNTIQPLAALSRLTHLNLGGTQVCDGQLRLVLPHLSALQELDVSHSPCTASGLGGLTALTHSLRVLHLRGCQVSDAGGAAALSCLLQLRVLDLSCSSISSRGLLLLAPLRHLHSLNLDMCHIGDEACRVFRALTSLAVLDLSDTEIGPGGVHHLRHCRAMLRLSLCNTDAGDGSAASLANLTCLTHLNLDARGVSDACIPLLLPVGRSLRELDLSGGRITSRGAAVIAAYMKQLEVLDLCGGHITDRACAELAKLAHLRELNLSQNRSLSDGGIRLLAAGLGDSLANLNVSYTSVTDESVSTLRGMKALQVVVLSYSCVSEAGALRLKQARPHLLIKARRNKTSRV